jgi:hypothetical protein
MPFRRIVLEAKSGKGQVVFKSREVVREGPMFNVPSITSTEVFDPKPMALSDRYPWDPCAAPQAARVPVTVWPWQLPIEPVMSRTQEAPHPAHSPDSNSLSDA